MPIDLIRFFRRQLNSPSGRETSQLIDKLLLKLTPSSKAVLRYKMQLEYFGPMNFQLPEFSRDLVGLEI